jgi:pSer/pThr/pTyr-binding forkhead associated (FHA) protein
MFDPPLENPEQTLEFPAPDPPSVESSLLEQARAMLSEPGFHLVCVDDGELQAFELDHGWTRIGRSATADVRLDDPTVSRRHALVVWEPGEPLRVLDDRSLNGIFLNGELVEWGTLDDGDELSIGRYRLILVEV